MLKRVAGFFAVGHFAVKKNLVPVRLFFFYGENPRAVRAVSEEGRGAGECS